MACRRGSIVAVSGKIAGEGSVVAVSGTIAVEGSEFVSGIFVGVGSSAQTKVSSVSRA